MSKERYRKGAHTVTDFKYHFVWKTKYSYGIFKGEIGLRLRDIIREVCIENSLGNNKRQCTFESYTYLWSMGE